MTVADILERAAERLSKPGAWIRGTYARNADGEWTKPDRPDATCFCMTGAIAAALSTTGAGAESWMDRHNIPRLLGFESTSQIPTWNDLKSRRKHEVVAKLREAAAKARESEHA